MWVQAHYQNSNSINGQNLTDYLSWLVYKFLFPTAALVFYNALYTKRFIIAMCSFTVSDFVDKTRNVHLTCRTQSCTEQTLPVHPYIMFSSKILRQLSAHKQKFNIFIMWFPSCKKNLVVQSALKTICTELQISIHHPILHFKQIMLENHWNNALIYSVYTHIALLW